VDATISHSGPKEWTICEKPGGKRLGTVQQTDNGFMVLAERDNFLTGISLGPYPTKDDAGFINNCDQQRPAPGPRDAIGRWSASYERRSTMFVSFATGRIMRPDVPNWPQCEARMLHLSAHGAVL
jgi:hypothetical protein